MRITIKGIVQGVGFRPAVYRTATSLGLRGCVWNNGADVIVDVDDADAFMNGFMENVPPLASIESVDIVDLPVDAEGFTIVPSSNGSGGVGIPTDTAICGNCLNDMKEGRRKGYEFTSCTDCGARFTLLSGIPYDRSNTSMNEFGMCDRCVSEYNDPKDRRFHHQTICCLDCGPRYRLLDNSGDPIGGDPVDGFASVLNSGGIGIAKSWGGMHICAVPDIITKLRGWYGRPQKPFALMVRDIKSIYKYAEPNDDEIGQLTSVHRPIVLLDKIVSNMTEALAPGLDNIGVFLPYTGMQHSLFDHLDRDALIMTSANLPGEPMLLNDDDVMELNADAYLLHDQRIINRADDSVLRVNNGNVSFIRRSRGHVPSPIPFSGNACAIGLGAQENLTSSIAYNGMMHSTQHIGDGDSLGVIEYLESSIRSLTNMLGCTPEMVAVDLHPGYSNRPLGRILSTEYECDIIEVQHHWAHAASLFVDNGIDHGIILSVDGTGYGDDGNAWGGEVMECDLHGYKRVAHLQNIPLLGSEKALYDLRRLKFAVDMINGVENNTFTSDESDILRKLSKKSIMTSSFGRLLDTLAFTLGVCSKRTYDGEPAMKMEPLLARGKYIEGFETKTINGEIMTADLFSRIDAKMKKEDVAYSIVRNVMKNMVESACDVSNDTIGITGGVSYNGTIVRMFSELVMENGREAIFHNRIPNGDGGISIGQAAIASEMIR